MNDILKNIKNKYLEKNGNVIFLLQETQEAFGYIPKEAVGFFSEELNIAPSRIYGVVTFYSQFRLVPTGKHVITACCGTACHVKGSERLINSIRQELELGPGRETTDDLNFTLETVNCVGACGIAPVVIINKKILGKASTNNLLKAIRLLQSPDKNNNE